MTAREQHEAYMAERKRAREAKRAKAKAAYEAGKHKYATYEEYIAAARARQKSYQEARKAGTWVRKNRIHSERVARNAGLPVGYDPNDPSTWEGAPPPPLWPKKTASVQQQDAGAEARQPESGEACPLESGEWDEIVMPYLGSHEEDSTAPCGLKRKLTPEEKRAAKSEWQRRYRELKRLAAGKPKRGRRKYATPEEAKEAARAYHRAYGKKYRALKKSGEWVPMCQRAAKDEGVDAPVEPKKCGRRARFATEEERRAAKNEYNRKYHLLRKTGLWVRKNRIFSERVAKSAGLMTEKERLAAAMAMPAKRLFGSEAEWKAAVEAKRGGRGVKARTEEERRELERIYNREYRRRKRAEALAVAQQTWTAEEWAKWRAKEEAKGRGKPERFVKEVVKFIAEGGKMSEDAVMEHLLEHGGVEFLMAGAEAIGQKRARTPAMVKAAARAVAFYVDPDGALMFPEE